MIQQGQVSSSSRGIGTVTISSTGVYVVSFSPAFLGYISAVTVTGLLDSVTTKPFLYMVTSISQTGCTVQVYDLTSTAAAASFNIFASL